ncbi:16S rRNA (cytidine(1402)-2'-O)-methyltransferase [Spiroplasma endosymbiont of Crioceris asparagi]|uniref:16S rRNA (cytidine(1402)-2'-O)-methyltransferase n=1 Tax=Spiroplasma endosymbiont of Crioceris asparagi TaxID=3066286 RepID=UPI0030CFAF64
MLQVQKSFNNKNSTIYFVTTPIGNLNEFNFRAINILKEVGAIFCEDTRTSKKLLDKFDIHNKTFAFHKFNELQMLNTLKQYIEKNQSIAIISDAGVPGFSDPGLKTIEQLLYKDNIEVNIVTVGAGSALNYALISAGIYFHNFIFLGFLERKKTKIQEEFLKYKNAINNQEDILFTFYESVHRIKDTIDLLKTVFTEDSLVAICREITKLNEEIIRGNLTEVSEFVGSKNFVDKGEFVVVVKPKWITKTIEDMNEIFALIDELVKKGFKLNESVKEVASNNNLDKKTLYKMYINSK